MRSRSCRDRDNWSQVPTIGVVTKNELALISEIREALADGTAMKRRQAARISQGEIAEASGVGQSTVSGWENNHRRPKADHALAYGRALAAAERKRLAAAQRKQAEAAATW